MQKPKRHQLAASFERFAKVSGDCGSPFYRRLAQYIAGDVELLEIAGHAASEPVPNAFLGAVHFLLLQNAQHELRRYYPSVSANPKDDEHLFEVFSNFCSHFKDELAAIISTRLVQTNEVNRCGILAPVFSIVHGLGRRQPLALVEVGASAGLNLLWDKYRIGYSDGSILGDPQSSVRIDCEIRGIPLPGECLDQPAIGHRVGVDFNPIDVLDLDQCNWLRALVWPDQQQRAKRLDDAIAVASQLGVPPVVRGDALAVLPDTLANVPRQLRLCVYHSSVLYQFTVEQRERLAVLLAKASAERPLWHVSAEYEEGLRLVSYRGGIQRKERKLAEFDAHGRWLRWEE
jgi:hypothetical protein